MALIDFGMKARRERDEARRELAECQALYAAARGSYVHTKNTLENVFKRSIKRGEALKEIASSTAKAGSAIRLANIARKALGCPVKGGGDE